MHELKQSIKISRDTSPGIDAIHYQLLKHLLDDSLLLLLYILNHIWLTQDFPTSWKTTIIIPVPKPCKVLSGPGSYRPIAHTSCLFKDSHAIRLLKINKILKKNFLFISVKNIVYFHSMYGIMLISPDNPNYIQFCEA